MFCGRQKILFSIDWFFSIKKLKSPVLTVPPLSHLTSCTPTKSNFYLANSLAAALREPDLYRLLKNIMSLFHCFGHTKLSVQVQGFLCEHFITRYVFSVRSCKHFVQPPKLGDYPMSDVPNCLFNIFAAAFHIGGHFSTHNLRTRHAVVIGTNLSRPLITFLQKINYG
jgi:hypothetical protein